MPTEFVNDIEHNPELQASVIALQNDLFRQALANPGIAGFCLSKGITGNVVFSHNMAARSPEFQTCTLQAVAEFNDFNADNDPHADHTFGVVTVGKRRLFFKIDLYDLELDKGSERPFDPACTERVLTIMDPEEY
ncbi:DUF3768 domain-containing protein [Ruegeria sp. HKCCD8929]|uniref:DUF3768 domain-containing protein n=1 Tax=Ruegeria sp. HKCCD8929 TaxID=2683006 RepID=UPI0014880172|nr:DUF3768 domain-containing protein [Ruegeria sp. HKCCD8929]